MECQDTQAPLSQPRSLGTGAPGNECLHVTSSPATWKHCAQAGVGEGTTANWDGVGPWAVECGFKRPCSEPKPESLTSR